MSFFDTLRQTLGGQPAPVDPRVHRAKYLEWDFYCFAEYWLVPGGDVHSSEVVEKFQAGVRAKYKGEVNITDLEALQLLARWNERYAKAKWTPKGRYIGFHLNPVAAKIAETEGIPAPDADALKKKKEKKKKKVRVKEQAKAPPGAPQPMTAVFTNSGSDPRTKNAELYYESTRWGTLGHGDDPVSVGSFPGHRWFIKSGDTVIKEIVISDDAIQEYDV